VDGHGWKDKDDVAVIQDMMKGHDNELTSEVKREMLPYSKLRFDGIRHDGVLRLFGTILVE